MTPRFYWYAGIVCTAYVVLAFGAAAIVQPFRLPRYVTPLTTLHIAVMFGWLGLYIAQARLAESDPARHRRNLTIGAVLVGLAVVQGIAMRVSVGNVPALVGEGIGVLVFAALFFLSVRAAKRGDYPAHTRLMFIALLNVVGPAHARLFQATGAMVDNQVGPGAFLFGILFLVVPPLAYDVVTERRLHRATITGLLLSLGGTALKVVVAVSPLMRRIESML